ncbi:hypothetical protein JOD52_002792 [Brachybacterium muris]|uniref:PQQ-like beta-propeller repeat protein n=1 Tax=Brachybacterium muris TaxID=219301 RepID=UPI00223BE8D7|nr:hypothetical protein [Brachybacterium muris]MCT2296424.1 PQQ-like beta-propeller repeat protein [Brachybacterium muris]
MTAPDQSDQASPEPPRFEYDTSTLSADEHAGDGADQDPEGAEQVRSPLDTTTAIGLAVTLLALAGLCALLGQHFLVGWLRLAAGLLAAFGVGALVLVALGRSRRAVAFGAAGAVAVLLAAGLTVPSVLSARPTALEDAALVSIPALADGDRVTSLPLEGSPVLVRRVDGTAELLRGTRVDTVDSSDGELLALSADGTRFIRVTGTPVETTVLDLPADAAPQVRAILPGAPLALEGDLLVLRTCTAGMCRISGHDLAAEESGTSTNPVPALWTISDGAGEQAQDVRGADAAGIAVPARAAQPPGLLDAVDQGGILPEVPLRFDPAQGWVQLDPATGFPLGSILAGPEEQCRIAVTAPPPAPQSLQAPRPVVLTVCSDEDGAMTATAFADGAMLWESDPSPAGEWTVLLDRGRVLASGTEAGTDQPGEIVAGETRAAWTAPGGPALQQASAFTTRIGIDGARMVITNDAGQLAAYDTAHGQNTWTHGVNEAETPDPGDDAPDVRGMLGTGSVVVLDPASRTAALDPRGGRRLRVIDAGTGEMTFESVVSGSAEPVAAVGRGSALVTDGDRTLLLGR